MLISFLSFNHEKIELAIVTPISEKSLLFLMGTEIDFEETMFGSQFVINNPKVKSSCGCGVSVTFDTSTIQEEKESIFKPTW